MGARQRRKGRRGELDACKALRAAGIAAERIHGQEEIGGRYGDVKTAAGNLEIKVRARLPKIIKPEPGVFAILLREDGMPMGDWLVVQRFGRWAKQFAAAGKVVPS